MVMSLTQFINPKSGTSTAEAAAAAKKNLNFKLNWIEVNDVENLKAGGATASGFKMP